MGARGRTAEVDADFGDILEAPDSLFAFSGRLEIGYGRIGGFIDGMSADLGADDQTGPGGIADIDIEFMQGMIDFGMMYRVVDVEPSGAGAANPRNLTLDLYAGGRYRSIELGVAAAAQASGDVSQGVGTGGRVAFPDGAASCGGRRRSRWLPARGWWWSRGRDRGYGSGPTRVHG